MTLLKTQNSEYSFSSKNYLEKISMYMFLFLRTSFLTVYYVFFKNFWDGIISTSITCNLRQFCLRDIFYEKNIEIVFVTRLVKFLCYIFPAILFDIQISASTAEISLKVVMWNIHYKQQHSFSLCRHSF